MLSLFTTAKPFLGHSAVIQRNALRSWTCLHPDAEVILFGEDCGAAEISAELGLRHEPHVLRNDSGLKRLDDMFARAQSIARYDLLCYINCDIILLRDFCEALDFVRTAHKSFLMVGRRWDTPISDPLAFEHPGTEKQLRATVRASGILRGPDCIDYFAFPRGLYADIPPLVVGRIWWDHWLAWKAGHLGAAVVDATSRVLAVHQNHDYGYHPSGAVGVWQDEYARRNYQLAGGRWRLHTIADATHILNPHGEDRNLLRLWAPYWRLLRPKLVFLWFALLGVTRPLRRLLGLHRRPVLTPRELR